MTFNPDKHHRRSIRLPGYDYRRAGAYFITICTHECELLYLDRDAANIAQCNWAASFEIRTELDPDEFVVMPNHIHGIVWIKNPASPNVIDAETAPSRASAGSHVALSPRGGAQALRPYGPAAAPRALNPAPARVLPRSLAAFIRGYKSSVTRDLNALRGTPGAPVWQRNYYEHIIRNEDSLLRIRQYIRDNPSRWAFDRDNPAGAPDAQETGFWRSVDLAPPAAF